jgi:Ni/Fe-hydrogenase subunit HybB-like protein
MQNRDDYEMSKRKIMRLLSVIYFESFPNGMTFPVILSRQGNSDNDEKIILSMSILKILSSFVDLILLTLTMKNETYKPTTLLSF